jgi:DNA-binding NarL/FixJ family response regulator
VRSERSIRAAGTRTGPTISDVPGGDAPPLVADRLAAARAARVSDSGVELSGVARAVALDAPERHDPDRVRVLRTCAPHAVLDEQRPPAHADPPRSALLELTPREQEVLSLLHTGRTDVELARALVISERTANRQVSNSYAKLGVRNRAEATRLAVEAGIAS